jgi:uncharacterized protein (DUF58 family)
MNRWLAALARVNRPGPDGQIRLAGRAIYVLPTKFGVLFLVLLLALLVGAINYANNPAFLLTFLLSGVGLATLLQTWRNLYGLQLGYLGDQPAFAGGAAGFRFRLEDGRGADRPALQLQLPDGEPELLDLAGGEHAVVRLQRPTTQRGRCRAGRMTVSTRYPLGLVRAWCYLESEAWSPVYPTPADAGTPWPDKGEGSEVEGRRPGSEDFLGLRDYRPGDTPRQVDWKALAGERGLLTKQFGSGGGEPLWLDWDAWPYLPEEARLSRLCREVLDAHQQGRAYGLRLPATVLEPALGESHRRACLTALALYGETP